MNFKLFWAICTSLAFSDVLAVECGAKSERGRKKGGREGERRKLSLLLSTPPLAVFPAPISCHRPNNLNAWDRIVRVKQRIFLVAQAIKIDLIAQVRYIYNSNMTPRL